MFNHLKVNLCICFGENPLTLVFVLKYSLKVTSFLFLKVELRDLNIAKLLNMLRLPLHKPWGLFHTGVKLILG